MAEGKERGVSIYQSISILNLIKDIDFGWRGMVRLQQG